MQHFPGFASRVDAAFGALTASGGTQWRVADTARALAEETCVHSDAASAEEEDEEEGGEAEDEGDEEAADADELRCDATGAFCRALDNEQEEAPEDRFALGGSSPRPDPRTAVTAEDDEPAQPTSVAAAHRGATLYILDEPLVVGSGAAGGGAHRDSSPDNVDAWRAATMRSAGAPPPSEPVGVAPVIFRGAYRRMHVAVTCC